MVLFTANTVEKQKARKFFDLRALCYAPGPTRTADPLLRRQMLYPTELRALVCTESGVPGPWTQDPGRRTHYKSGREDSNLRPPAPKAGALPNCATPRRLAMESIESLGH